MKPKFLKFILLLCSVQSGFAPTLVRGFRPFDPQNEDVVVCRSVDLVTWRVYALVPAHQTWADTQLLPVAYYQGWMGEHKAQPVPASTNLGFVWVSK